MVNILFLAFEFHPLNIGGVFRSIHFVKYLRNYGINPIVCCLQPDCIPEYFTNEIIEKDSKYPFLKEITVVGIPSKLVINFSSPLQYFSIRDRDTLIWEKNAAQELVTLKQQYNPKAIFVTAPPFTITSFGRRIAAKLQLPLILDMRDAWTLWNISPYKSYIHYLLTKKEEGKCLAAAALITATSQQTIADFKRLHPKLDKSKFTLITNGYDTMMAAEMQKPLSKTGEKIVIGYSGGFYYNPEFRANMFAKWWTKKIHRWFQYSERKEDWLYRSPYFIFKSMACLREQNRSVYDQLQLRFIGKKPSWFDGMVREFGVEDCVQHLGQVSHQESLQFQEKCDYLLITSSKVIGGRDYSIAGKTFEYISMLKPILSFVCEGAQKDLLAQTGLAILCNPDDTKENAVKITNLVEGKISLQPNEAYIKTLSRENQTALLAKEILRVVAP